MPKGPVWTEREEAMLIKGVNKGEKPDEISKRFKELHNFHDDVHLRSGEAIRRHLRSMKSRKGNAKPGNSRRKWEPDHDQRLLELFRDTQLEHGEIGLRLERSEGAVKARIKTLGIGHLREPQPMGFLPGLVARVTSLFRRPGHGK